MGQNRDDILTGTMIVDKFDIYTDDTAALVEVTV